MKKFFASTIVLSAILFSSCDYVKDPIQPHGAGSANDTVRKVLIEDVTGHLCINCPSGARIIDSLESVFPGQIIPMALHSGFFAEPCPPHGLPSGAPAGTFGEDFRAPLEDADYDNLFGINGWPNPMGMVNRYGVYPGQNPTSATAWPDTAAVILADSISAYIKIHPTYNSSNRQLTLTVSGILFDTLIGNYDIAVYLTEDGLHGWQLDNALPPPSFDSTYTFNHVFRGSVNNPGHVDGVQVLSGTTNRGALISYNMSTPFTVSSSYNAANCKLVGILYDAATYRVVQADQVNLQ
ncbi:MAG TPA: Omp28-related outer membrane protein [Bacteroidia bacterium]|jgi:hypothetical protein|nr:Omp28-related outer membrane protein [Bacteroidia bacterium]